MKRMIQSALIKALDELTEIIDSNAARVKRLKDSLTEELPTEKTQLLRNGIVKYNNLSALTNKVCDIYLVLLDINTYGTYCMIADDEWEWRAFARHIYTILYEHSTSVSKQINDIIRIIKADVIEGYDLTPLLTAKKDYSKFINDNSELFKQIRVKVDAHYDAEFSDRLSLIKDLSYCNVFNTYYTYTSKMQGFLHELKPVLDNLRLSADIAYNSI